MTRFALILAALIAPGMAQAACTGDLPQSGVLNVYTDATSDGVIGGIGANQCGLEVTDFCENGRCLTFFDGLSGYVEVSGLVSGTIDAPPKVFEYEVADIDGALTFMGRTQPFELADSGTIRVTPAADHVVLSLPAPLPSNIRMTSTGSSGWEAVMPDWVGVPIPVTVFLDRLGAKSATLELLADDQMLKMDMRLRLSRIGTLPDLSAKPQAAPPPAATAPIPPNACDKTLELAEKVGQGGDRAQIDGFYAAVQSAGITDWENRTEAQCLDLLAALTRAGIPAGDAPGAGNNAPETQTCDALVADIRPILRGPASPEKTSIMSTMLALGITSIDPTNPKHCAEISAAKQR